jgi:hypothetical protein
LLVAWEFCFADFDLELAFSGDGFEFLVLAFFAEEQTQLYNSHLIHLILGAGGFANFFMLPRCYNVLGVWRVCGEAVSRVWRRGCLCF